MSVIVDERDKLTVRPCTRVLDLEWAGQARLAPWFDPARIAPANTCAPVYYDALKVRQIIGRLGLRSQTLLEPSTVRELWHSPHTSDGIFKTPSQRYVEADVALDEHALTFGSATFRPRFARRLDEPVGSSAQVVASRTRWAHAVHAQGLALAIALSAGSPFQAHRGHLRPDESIECVIERAFAFAATSILAGVDQLVARTWASAIMVSNGMPRPLMTLGVDRAIDDGDWLFPKRTLVSEYFLQSLADLKVGDATRFMVLAARCAVETQTSASGHPGTG